MFFTLAGVLVTATLVFWILGSGQRQWWAIYVEVPPPQAPVTNAQPVAAADAASDADVTSLSDEKKNAEDEQLANTDKTRLDSAKDVFASYMRQEQRKQQQQQRQDLDLD